jgi:hypothetical protein
MHRRGPLRLLKSKSVCASLNFHLEESVCLGVDMCDWRTVSPLQCDLTSSHGACTPVCAWGVVDGYSLNGLSMTDEDVPMVLEAALLCPDLTYLEYV